MSAFGRAIRDSINFEDFLNALLFYSIFFNYLIFSFPLPHFNLFVMQNRMSNRMDPLDRAMASGNPLSGFSLTKFIFGVILFFFFGFFYWTGSGGSGVTRVFQRLQLTGSPWILFYVHLGVLLVSLKILFDSNLLRVAAYTISTSPWVNRTLEGAMVSDNFLIKQWKKLYLSVILTFFVLFVGTAILDMITGLLLPKKEIILSVFLAGMGYIIYKIEYLPYVKPKPIAANEVIDKHLVWENYQTDGKIKLGDTQYCYKNNKNGSYQLRRQHQDMLVHPLSEVFFFRPSNMKFKFNKREIGIGSVRGNVLFDAELKLEETNLPENINKKQLDFLVKVFRNENSAIEFIQDTIPGDKLAAAQAAAIKVGNQITSYVLSNKAAVEEDSAVILDKLSDLSGYNEIIHEMRAAVDQKIHEQLGTNNLIYLKFNMTDDGINKEETLAKIEKAKEEARRNLQNIIDKFVDAISARIAQRGGNIDPYLVQRVTEILGNLTGKQSYQELDEAKRRIKAVNEETRKKGKRSLENFEILDGE